MTKKIETLADIFAEEEERRTAEARREIAAEQAAWDALTPEEKAAKLAENEAKWAAYADAVEAAEAEPDEDEDEEEESE